LNVSLLHKANVIVFCRSGARAVTAKQALSELGYTNVSKENENYYHLVYTTFTHLTFDFLSTALQCWWFGRFGLPK